MKYATLAILLSFTINSIPEVAAAKRGYYWQNAARHSFCSNFPAGREADGRKLYISQANRAGILLGVIITIVDDGSVRYGPLIQSERGTWHIGKAGTHLKEGMTYPYGGKEHDVGRVHIPQGNKYEHMVLCLNEKGLANRDFFKWVGRRDGSSHPNAVKGFNDVEKQVVCRAKWGGGLHPGKLIPSSGSCFIGYGGGEKAVKTYEVLTYQEK